MWFLQLHIALFVWVLVRVLVALLKERTLSSLKKATSTRTSTRQKNMFFLRKNTTFSNLRLCGHPRITARKKPPSIAQGVVFTTQKLHFVGGCLFGCLLVF